MARCERVLRFMGLAKLKKDKSPEWKLSNGWLRSYKEIKLPLSAGYWVVAKLQWEKSASQASMELYYPWNSGPLYVSWFLGDSQKGGFQKGGFGGCSPVPKSGMRVHSDVPGYQKPEQGYVRMFPGTKNRWPPTIYHHHEGLWIKKRDFEGGGVRIVRT